MKLASLLLSLILLAGCAHVPVPPPPPPPNLDFTIKVSWSYDFTNFAACSGTVTKGCISGFTWGYMQGSTQVPLHTVTTASCSGTTQPVACADTTNSQLPMGSLTGYIVANFVDNSGSAGSTPSNNTASPTVVAAGAPTGFTWVSVQ